MAIGWRARIGVLIPSVNTTLEPEYYRVAPAGVTFHSVRMRYERDHQERYESMLADLDHGMQCLADAGVSAIAFACTSGSLYGGPGYDQQLIAAMQRSFGGPCTTTATAVTQALRALGLRRVAVATPYADEINRRVQLYLEASGFEVREIRGLRTPAGASSLSREILCPFVRGFDSLAAVDGLLLSCTGLPTLAVLEELEQDLNIPVISSNQATLWQCLALARVQSPVPGWGRLLRRDRSATAAPPLTATVQS